MPRVAVDRSLSVPHRFAHLLDVDHDKAVNLGVFVLKEPAAGERHDGGWCRSSTTVSFLLSIGCSVVGREGDFSWAVFSGFHGSERDVVSQSMDIRQLLLRCRLNKPPGQEKQSERKSSRVVRQGSWLTSSVDFDFDFDFTLTAASQISCRWRGVAVGCGFRVWLVGAAIVASFCGSRCRPRTVKQKSKYSKISP